MNTMLVRLCICQLSVRLLQRKCSTVVIATVAKAATCFDLFICFYVLDFFSFFLFSFVFVQPFPAVDSPAARLSRLLKTTLTRVWDVAVATRPKLPGP